jgi:DNA-binding response OmpR family regulator
MRLLVVEDETSLADAIKEGLEDHYFTVDVAYDGESALDKIEIEETYDLIILDIMLPKIDGIALLKKIREEGYKMPVLMLTARDGVDDKVRSLDSGADDYLTKPFDFRELLARIRAITRRNKESKNSILKIDDLVVNRDSHVVIRNGKEIELTRKEYEILEYLLLNKGRVIPKSELESHLWDENAKLWSDPVRTHVKNLRKKIDKGFKKELIVTIRGIGYKIKND